MSEADSGNCVGTISILRSRGLSDKQCFKMQTGSSVTSDFVPSV